MLGSYRGQEAVNSFAVLNTLQRIKTARALLVNGAEYMFLEATRERIPRKGTVLFPARSSNQGAQCGE